MGARGGGCGRFESLKVRSAPAYTLGPDVAGAGSSQSLLRGCRARPPFPRLRWGRGRRQQHHTVEIGIVNDRPPRHVKLGSALPPPFQAPKGKNTEDGRRR